ncbi:MAG: helix-turn-helix transcriptional regulator [Clostridia bacterium]|nr:helix-turn-helix transcriptional regulator [Clostridia bacterium]
MLKINEYNGKGLAKELQLKVFYCGSAKLDSSWQGRVACAPVSKLYYVKTGSFYLILDGNRIDLTEGNWYLVPSGSSYEYGCDRGTEQLFFHLTLTGTEKIDLFGRQPALLRLQGNQNPAEQLAELLASDTEIAAHGIKNMVMNILIKLISEYNIGISEDRYSSCLIKALNYIDKNLSKTLTIKGISDAIFVSESTLTKCMRQELGTTVNHYIDDLILNRAAQMIAEGVLSFNAISNRLGFCDQFYFSRKFKAKFGVTPSEYKKTPNI